MEVEDKIRKRNWSMKEREDGGVKEGEKKKRNVETRRWRVREREDG